MMAGYLKLLLITLIFSRGMKYISEAFMMNKYAGNICRIGIGSKNLFGRKQKLFLSSTPDILRHNGILENSESSFDDKKSPVFIMENKALNLSGCGAKIVFNSHLIVEGTLMGAELVCHDTSNTHVTIEKGGELHADISCVETVIVKGRLVGNVTCKKLKIMDSGEVIGDVSAEFM